VLNKDTRVCISLAGRPSDLGTRFHNFLYAELGLDFLYKACTTSDLEGAVRGVRALGFRGCSVSMPFKAAVIPLRRNRTIRRAYDRDLYQARHLIENFFCQLKQYRAIATRYDKTRRNFLAAVHLAASAILLN
jgi:hypothetical protein